MLKRNIYLPSQGINTKCGQYKKQSCIYRPTNGQVDGLALTSYAHGQYRNGRIPNLPSTAPRWKKLKLKNCFLVVVRNNQISQAGTFMWEWST